VHEYSFAVRPGDRGRPAGPAGSTRAISSARRIRAAGEHVPDTQWSRVKMGWAGSILLITPVQAPLLT
jgi:hypothetical protein